MPGLGDTGEDAGEVFAETGAIEGVGTDGVGTTRGPVTEFGAAVVGGGGRRVAPHMPQKRFVPGFSLPQRAQRTDPPLDSCL
jgi:hypothetical protein